MRQVRGPGVAGVTLTTCSSSSATRANDCGTLGGEAGAVATTGAGLSSAEGDSTGVGAGDGGEGAGVSGEGVTDGVGSAGRGVSDGCEKEARMTDTDGSGAALAGS